MTELKPCPFCGNAPELIKENGGWTIECKHHGWPKGKLSPTAIAGDIDLVSWGDTAKAKEKLIEAWNTRAERTCEIARVETGEPAEHDCDEVLWHCASCHEEVAIYAYNENGDTWADKPAFCPNCGAKVVE